MIAIWRKSIRYFITSERELSRRHYSLHLIEYAEVTLKYIHQSTSLPWWAVITGVTVTLRSVITVPLAVRQNKILTRMEMLAPTVKEYTEALKHNIIVKCRREGASLEETNRRYKLEARKMVRQLYSNEGCHPIKVMLLPWIQLPLWIIISLALRNISGIYQDIPSLPSLSTEGVLWFSDLSVPDPLFILPVLLSVSNLLNIEMHALRRRKASGRLQMISTKLFRILSVSIGLVACQLPSAMTLYWSTSSLFSLAQNSLLMLPKVRRKLKIPKTPSESTTPYKDIVNNLRQRCQDFIKIQS